MPDAIDLLTVATYALVAVGGGCYVYGYIIKPRGDRRWHVASLLLSTMALANLPVIFRKGAEGALYNGYMILLFLGAALLCQAVMAFRGRAGDRRRAATVAAAERASTSAPVSLELNGKRAA